MMVLVLCANAGIDRIYEVENFAPGQYHIPRRYRVAAGGKGINVARTLRLLGTDVLLTGFAGGLGGRLLQQQMVNLGVQPFLVPIAEESRVCIQIVDTKSRSQTRLDEVGPLVTPSEVEGLQRRWIRLLAKAQVAVIAGNVPRGVPLNLYADLIRLAQRSRVPILLDAHDELLARAIEAKPRLIKPNLEELQALMGRPISVPEGVLQAIQELIGLGIDTVVVTLGARGAIAANARQERYWVKPGPMDCISAVGSGDAMMGGIAAAWAAGRGLAEQLRLGTAAAAANCTTFDPCAFEARTLHQCLQAVTLTPLTPGGSPQEEATDGLGRTEEQQAGGIADQSGE